MKLLHLLTVIKVCLGANIYQYVDSTSNPNIATGVNFDNCPSVPNNNYVIAFLTTDEQCNIKFINSPDGTNPDVFNNYVNKCLKTTNDKIGISFGGEVNAPIACNDPSIISNNILTFIQKVNVNMVDFDIEVGSGFIDTITQTMQNLQKNKIVVGYTVAAYQNGLRDVTSFPSDSIGSNILNSAQKVSFTPDYINIMNMCYGCNLQNDFFAKTKIASINQIKKELPTFAPEKLSMTFTNSDSNLPINEDVVNYLISQNLINDVFFVAMWKFNKNINKSSEELVKMLTNGNSSSNNTIAPQTNVTISQTNISSPTQTDTASASASTGTTGTNASCTELWKNCNNAYISNPTSNYDCSRKYQECIYH
ncbi:hypothetical protein HDV06_001494 [Boothiomyces sp. JEL0866]|nr:hypothetical protein HDV06_001494 [Boothiomyces sp. JEL0866]